MSDQDINRFKVLQDVRERRIRQIDAADILNITPRQVRRLSAQLSQHGASSLAHGLRGKPSNRRYPDAFRARILDIIRNHYADFSPTFACEKLTEKHDLIVSVETLRQWMIADGLWIPRTQRRARIYQPRYRRDCLGELVQIDGSHHDWFEGRSPKCCLLVYIDDATGRLMNLRFSDTESAFDYMVTTREYLNEHGKPVAFYSDKHSIFRVNQERTKQVGLTQFGRDINDLGIELICANSSQAKGRVERANKTLQDRLVKEMRLQGIDTIEEANLWLPHFIEDFNQRFAKPAQYPKDLHRTIQETPEELDDIFAWHSTRKLSKSLTFQYDKVLYLIDKSDKNARLVNEVVKVLDYPDGQIAVQYGERKLRFSMFDKLAEVDQTQVVDNKRLGKILEFAQEKQEEFEKAQLRERSQSSPKRTAQKRAMAQLKALNPVLVEPDTFQSSHSRPSS